MRRAVLLGGLLLPLVLPRTAHAQPPSPELLEKLSHHAIVFEEIARRGSFTFDRMIEELDRSGKVDERKHLVARVDKDGKHSTRTIVLKAEENGRDTTQKEQDDARKENEKEAKDHPDGHNDDAFHMPFLASEQPRYVFDQVATDPADPTRVQISFVPKKAAKNTIEGSAWVDTVSGTVISTGVKLSQPPEHVDWVHVTAEFGAKTPLGPAISHVTFEAKGGFLFIIRKHFHVDIHLTDYQIAPQG